LPIERHRVNQEQIEANTERSTPHAQISNSDDAFCIRRWMLGVERWVFSLFYIGMTIFLGCGFAAKYREGGGNFSVPLQ